jgi:hypothetical protein
MSSERESHPPAAGDRGVFGNLPSERPGVRSPRRGEGGGTRPKGPGRAKAKATAAKPAPRAAPTPPPRPADPPPHTPEAEEPGVGSRRGGVEEVAWAGITVAAEAATLGVRLFSRALEAVRERR